MLNLVWQALGLLSATNCLYLLLQGTSSNLTASSSGGAARNSSTFSDTAVAIATEIAENEIAHVRYLRQALTAAGATAVPCPSLALSPAIFTAAATAAVSALNDTIATNTSATAFNPYSSDAAFYLGAYIFEDVGVTAYKGAVKVLQSQAYATIAAGIEAVEAGHAAIIRYQLYQIASSDTGLYLNSGDAITFETAVTAINALRDALGGTSSSSVESPLTRTPTAVSGVTIASPGPDLFAADANSVAFTRIPKQVLDIVYFGSYTTPGGYFPYGIAGNTDVDNINGDDQEGNGAEEPVDDTGELDFTYDDSLLQGEEEEDTAVLATQQKVQEDQETGKEGIKDLKDQSSHLGEESHIGVVAIILKAGRACKIKADEQMGLGAQVLLLLVHLRGGSLHLGQPARIISIPGPCHQALSSQAPAAGPTPAASIPPEVIHFLNRISQQAVNLPMLQQMQPDGFFNGMRPPHHAMMGPAVPPPRPPQGPPPPGPKPNLPHSAAPFFAGAPNFAPLTSIPMESRPQSGNPSLEVQGARPRQKPPGWSLSHGMEGLDRTRNGQEPMLAADMVWDAEGQGNASSHDAGPTRSEPFRNPSAGQRTGMPGGGAFAVGPRGANYRPPAPAQNKAAELAKNQAALAAAKARFAQQQKENDEIAERTKRQRLGLPEPRPMYQETEIDRLKRQIAEKEAAVKAGQALLPAVIKV
ncbi:MAG: hypothetical protein FRX49_01101 [Trebouxia sp. A1-2]|nr:MAG: hypothetical protein FRX49_01101 [Trebouxia sp. A1-2]